MGLPTPTPTVFIPYHALDALLQRGTRAAQPPAAAVVPGTLYSVTDEGDRLERSDGAGWQPYAGTPAAAPQAHAASHAAGGSDPVTGPLAVSAILANDAFFDSLGTTPLDASQLAVGMVPDARLSPNVPLTYAANVFTAAQQAPRVVVSDPSFPQLYLTQSGQPADARKFQVMNTGQVLSLRATNDAETVASPGLALTRAGVVSASGQPMAAGEKTSDQPLTHGVFAVMTWEVSPLDIGDCHNPAVNNSRFTAPVGGVYLCVSQLVFTASPAPAGNRMVVLRKNGAVNIVATYLPAVAFDLAFFQATGLALLAAGDFMEVLAYQDSGVDLAVSASGSSFSWIKVW